MSKALDLSSFSLLNRYQSGGSAPKSGEVETGNRPAHTVNDKVILNFKKGLNNYVYTNDNSLMYDNCNVADTDVNSQFTDDTAQALTRMRKYAEKKYPKKFGRQAWTKGGVQGGATFVPDSRQIYGLDYEIMNYLMQNGDIKRTDNPRFANDYLPSGFDKPHADSNDVEYRYIYDEHELSTNKLNNGDGSTQEKFQAQPYEFSRLKGSNDKWTSTTPNTKNPPLQRSTRELDMSKYKLGGKI